MSVYPIFLILILGKMRTTDITAEEECATGGVAPIAVNKTVSRTDTPILDTARMDPSKLIRDITYSDLVLLVNTLVDKKLSFVNETENVGSKNREEEIVQRVAETKKTYAECVSLKESIKKVTDTEQEVQVQLNRLQELSKSIRADFDKEQVVRVNKEEQEQKKLRERTLILKGLAESNNENMYDEINSLLLSGGCEIDIDSIENAYRVGAKLGNGQNNFRPRNVKIVLRRKETKRYLYDITSHVRENRYYKAIRFEPDLNSTEMLESRTVQQVASLARERNAFRQIKMRGSDILLDNVLYKPKDMNNLPKGISAESAAKRTYEWGQAFQGHNAPFSNFYKCKIDSMTNNGKSYSSAEQYFAILMAEDHGLTAIRKQIENTSNPYHIKAITNSIVKSNTWKDKAEGLLEKIVKTKFEQNPEIRELLLSSKGLLIEATKCPVWGCGLFLHETKAGNKPLNGYQNKMGKLLVRVRDSLKGK